MKDDGRFELAAIGIYLGLLLIGAYGWVWNIIAIWHSTHDPLTAQFILRVVGIFVFPVGAILGYVS